MQDGRGTGNSDVCGMDQERRVEIDIVYKQKGSWVRDQREEGDSGIGEGGGDKRGMDHARVLLKGHMRAETNLGEGLITVFNCKDNLRS